MVTALALFVFGLTYRAEHSGPPDPTYDFYDSASVKIRIHGSEGIHDIFGRYNHILHGQRILIKADLVAEGMYQLSFPIYSPRPAMLYVDDDAHEIFLNPGDTTLQIELWYDPISFTFDSIHYKGSLASVCQYYHNKAQQFHRSHIRGLRNTLEADDFATFCSRLDSMAAWELGLLSEQQFRSALPDWFVEFERNDILYQKAYLKLAQSLNRQVDSALLDYPLLDNEGASFSYYYYLYLHTYFSQFLLQAGDLSGEVQGSDLYRQLPYADSLLRGSPHDVFFTRVIYSLIQQRELELASEMLHTFRDRFGSKKYYRYLRKRLENAYQPS